MDVGLYAGSFDPVHLGHVALMAAASGKLDRLVVVVAANPMKAGGLFSFEERVEMLSGACLQLPNVIVRGHEGLVLDVASQVGANLLVRSAGKEHVDERQMAYLNGCDGLPTLLIPTDPATARISSSLVRNLIAAGAFDAIVEVVPAGVIDVLDRRDRRGLQTRF